MKMESAPKEKLGPKDFGLDPKPNRESGHVLYQHGGRTYDWFMTENGSVILANGNEKDFSSEIIQAMKLQVRSLLGPVLKDRLSKLSQKP